MSIKKQLLDKMSLPVIAAPMFIVSGDDLVIACCKEGILGTFPVLSARTSEVLDQMLTRIRRELDEYQAEHPEKKVAPFGANLILHSSNPRAQADIDLVIKHQVPFVVASVGNPADVVGPIHEYGGIIFADVATVKHAKSAIAAGVDGLILLTGGTGGHTGWLNPFAFVREVRDFYDGPIVLAGSISHGASIKAAEVLGADFVYMGSRFLAANESDAVPDYKQMLVDCGADDIVTSDAVTGLVANFLRPSLAANGFKFKRDGSLLVEEKEEFDLKNIAGGAKAWKDVWCCGQGINSTKSVISVKEIVADLQQQYDAAG